MSESTSSPSNVHPISPSSSLSSTDSAPRSDPTSDEQPDLGFNELLREYLHLQPHPRIPIQIRSATSSTTPTYHAESVTGSDFRVRSGRANSRSTQSALSSLSISTFTRPPTSSLHPEGSTVWTHPLIATYLPSSTPSNETLPEEDEDEDDYSLSDSPSRASTALTVEIRDFRSFDDESRDLDPDGSSPEPTSAIPIPVLASGNFQQLDSLQTPQTEDDIDSLSSHDRRGDSSMTSRDIIRRTVTSSSQELSDSSMQLQSQVIPAPSTSSLSIASSGDAGVSISIAGPSAPSSINSRIDSTVELPTSSESASTLMNGFLHRSRNPIPPRTASDSSFPTSSALSLISYQLPETPFFADVHREESESEMLSDRPQLSTGTRSILSTSSTSTSTAMLTQSFLSSASLRSTGLAQRFNSSLANPHSLLAVTPLSNPHSITAASPLTNPHSLPAASPLMNPYSSASTPEIDPRFSVVNDRFTSTALGTSHSREVTVVDDLDTPDNPPSEAILYEPSRRIFEPFRDDEDEPSSQISTILQSRVASYHPGGRTPQHLSVRTPIGIPTIRSQDIGDAQPTSFEIPSLERRPGALDTSRLPPDNRRFMPAGPAEAFIFSVQPSSFLRKQGTLVELSPSSMEFEEEHPLPLPTSRSLEKRRAQDYPTSLGLHLLPSEPLRALVVPSSSQHNLLREIDSPQTQFPAEASGVADLEAEQLHAEVTTSQTGLLPSLGYLDEALSFIATERVRRLTAARASASGLTTGGSSPIEELGRESEGEGDGLRQQEGQDWRDAIGAEKGSESKRKRRRKRPSKQPGQQVPVDFSPTRNGFHAAGSSSSPKKRRSKSAAPPLAFSTSMVSVGSSKSGTMTPGRRKDKYKGKEFLIPPPPSSSDPRSNIADSDFDDGGRTPTSVPVPGLIRVSALLGLNSTGVKGKRVGRREKLKFDMSKARNFKDKADPDSFDDPIDIGVEYDPFTDNYDGPEAIEESGEGLGENDSISNMSLLQPPRRLRAQGKRNAGEASLDLITKDISTTAIGPISAQASVHFQEDEINNRGGDENVFRFNQKDRAKDDKEKKKRTRPKLTTLIAAYPSLDRDAELADSAQLEAKEPTTDDRSKQSRLLALAQSLQQVFPEQRDELARVIKRIEKHRVAPVSPQKVVVSADTAGSSERGLGKSMPIPVPGKGKKARKSHASEGAITTGSESLEALPHVSRPMTDVEEEREEEDIDPRGRPPKRKDPLIHVFIDHSNILIGLLSHLRRATPYRKRIYITRRKPLPAVVTPISPQAKADPIAAAVKSTNSRPLPTLPTISDHSPSSTRDYPIPLPSFATSSRSLPSASLLSSMRRRTDEGHSSEEFERKRSANSDGYDGSGIDGGHGSGSGGSAVAWQKKKKPSKHLWHAALILILERGRPITRRVVVASKPLYQPMETIERFGYDLRVFIRVPDLGDGMDREHNAEKGKTTSVGKTSSHAKRISGSESGSGGNASGAAAGGSNNNHNNSTSLQPYYGKSNLGSSPTGKIKYREQGVDELLQLKLHQAIAATDDVPDGSTIILATGDGNMGQFNEEGFVGPIRTALRRGWKVELYAWEGGLSRAWKREFGEDTEWGKRGRFRIIGMEQYASWLVEASEWA